MGEPDFIDEKFSFLYGPPPKKRVHRCASCGFTWETNRMIDDERWCPKCGGSAPPSEDDARPPRFRVIRVVDPADPGEAPGRG